MIRFSTPKLGTYAALTAITLLGALVSGRAELVELGSPFAFVLTMSLLLARTPRLDVGVAVDRERVIEGEQVTATVSLRAERGIEQLELLLVLPRDLRVVAGEALVVANLKAGETETVTLGLEATRWGLLRVGELRLRARGITGCLVHAGTFDVDRSLRSYPASEKLDTLVAPRETQVTSGNRTARASGDGIELSELRQYAPGDRLRRINWRASARRGELWVSDRHPERNAEVVVFVDSFDDAGDADRRTIDDAVRASSALVDGYLATRDRVGLVAFGAFLRWLVPGSGQIQRYRLIDALIDTQVVASLAWKGIEIIPAGTLPPKALIVAVTPLLDDRTIGALLDARARGFDLAVIEISPLPYVIAGESPPDQLAHRLWLLARRARRERLMALGVAVVDWQPGATFEGMTREVSAFRRGARIARV